MDKFENDKKAKHSFLGHYLKGPDRAFEHARVIAKNYWREKSIDYHRAPRNDSSKPIVDIYMVHGLGDTPGNLKPMAEYFLGHISNDYEVNIHLLAFEFRGPCAKIEDYAKELVEKIKEDTDKAGQENKNRVRILIGHSRGGLIVTKAEDLISSEQYKVSSFITIDCPFQGALLATLVSGIWSSIRQMESGSAFLKEINNKENWDNYVFIKDTQDWVVINPVPKNAPTEKCYELAGGGHLATMRSHKVHEKIGEIIQHCVQSFQPELHSVQEVRRTTP